MKTGNRIAGISSGIALLAFFLPWVVVSCGAQPVIEMSGYEMATGHVSSVYATSSETIDGRPLLFITLGTAAVGVFIFISTYFDEKIVASFNVIEINLGILGIAAILLTLAQIKSESAGGMFPTGISVEYGFWLSIIGQAGMAIGGTLSIADANKKPEEASKAGTFVDVVRQLNALNELHSQGVVDDDEFKQAKQKILEAESSISLVHDEGIEEPAKSEEVDQRIGLLSLWIGVLKSGKARRAIILATIASLVSWNVFFLPNEYDLDLSLSRFTFSLEGIVLWFSMTGFLPLILGIASGLSANFIFEKEEWSAAMALVFGATLPIILLW